MMQSSYVVANGIRIHYHRTGGNKPQVLLLHGLTDNGACWTPVIDALKDDYDCIAPDARGHGLSDAPAHGYAPADHAADAAGLIQSLKLDRPAVMGHSMGGAVAAVLASQHPELVRAVIAEDPAWFVEVRTPSPDQSEAMKKGWLDGMRENKTKTREAMIAGERARNPKWSMDELEPWADAHEQVHEEVLQWMDAPPVDWRAALKRIQCPILLVTGDVERGVIISPAQALEAQSLNAKLQVANIAGTGHCIRRDDFAAFMQAVRDFLAKTK
jgi:N-formylmaleamate deformylase